MNNVAKILEAVAAVAWPAMAFLLIMLFRPAVGAIIDSARSRKFTLKLGGQELTMEEATNQERALIADLQAQVVELRKVVGGDRPREAREAESAVVERTRTGAVLWVDDEPKNNGYFVQQLLDADVKVDIALSTAQALQEFTSGAYAAVISDMGRAEEGSYRPTAGLDLLQSVRERDKRIPFIIYCSPKRHRECRETALALGATAITSSPTRLLGLLHDLGLLRGV